MRPSYAIPPAHIQPTSAILATLKELVHKPPRDPKGQPELCPEYDSYVAELCEEFATFRARDGGGRAVLEAAIPDLINAAVDAKNPSFISAIGQITTNEELKVRSMTSYWGVCGKFTPRDETADHPDFIDFEDRVVDVIRQSIEAIPAWNTDSDIDEHLEKLVQHIHNYGEESTLMEVSTLTTLAYRLERFTALMDGEKAAQKLMNDLIVAMAAHPESGGAVKSLSQLLGTPGIETGYDRLATEHMNASTYIDPVVARQTLGYVDHPEFDTKTSFALSVLLEKLNTGTFNPKR
jgi:hypothetical protein